MIISHNIAAMNAQRQYKINTDNRKKSTEKLSSGYRINRAADDAAGLSISEKMRRQIRGLTQASFNSQDGISFVQIADGALNEVHDIIQRGNELATKAANDTLTNEDREYGHGYLACAYLCQLASQSSSVSKASLLSGANKIFNALLNNESTYASTGIADSFQDVINSVLSSSGSSLTLNDVINNINNGENGASEFVLNLTKASLNTSSSLNGAGSLIASSLNSPGLLGAITASQQQMYVENSITNNSSNGTDTTIYLQVGSETSSYDEIKLKRFELSQNSLGITLANTLTMQDSLKCISYFKGALRNVSNMRSYYGSMQNRLEHTHKNLINIVENTQNAESLIRDTDMSYEMVKYYNSNILTQAGQSMLAQTNTTMQGVMALLQ